MWPSWRRPETVTCIACGASVTRDEAREYDKYGDRWDRDGKEFEHLCKPCDQELCRQPRDDLETVLIALEAGEHSQVAFVDAYMARLEDRQGRLEES